VDIEKEAEKICKALDWYEEHDVPFLGKVWWSDGKYIVRSHVLAMMSFTQEDIPLVLHNLQNEDFLMEREGALNDTSLVAHNCMAEAFLKKRLELGI
jgi:hypothetical protein